MHLRGNKSQVFSSWKKKGEKRENSTLTPAGMKRIPHSRTALRGFRVTLSPCVRRSQSWAVEHVGINAAGYRRILAEAKAAGTIQRPRHSAVTRDRIPGWS